MKDKSTSPEHQEKPTEIEFANLKYEIGQLLYEKFIQYNEGKFHTGIELNPATHAITELVLEKLSSLESELKALRDTLHAKDKDNNDLKQIVSAYSDVVHMKDAAILAKDKEFEALREERDKFAIEFLKWYTQVPFSEDTLNYYLEQFKAYTLNTEKKS